MNQMNKYTKIKLFGIIVVLVLGVLVISPVWGTGIAGRTGSEGSENMNTEDVSKEVSKESTAAKSIYDFEMKDIDGNNVSLAQYKGKVVMLVNVASKCGLTPQYKLLQEIYMKYKDQGFVILGFPANNFREQEPGTNSEIKEFCSLNFHVEFPMFSKISVLGSDIHPLYTFLTSEETNPGFSGEIRWNFDKFLVDRTGKMIARFHPKTTPTDAEVIKAIEAALK